MLQENVGKCLCAGSEKWQIKRQREEDKEGEGEEQMRRQRAFAAETDVANFSIFIISALVFWRLPLKKKVFA